MKKWLKYMVPLVIVVAVLGLIYKARMDSVPVFDVVKIKTDTWEDTYEEDGVVKIGESKTILSKISGEISEIHFKENDVIKKGDLLLRINTADLEKQLEVLKANKLGMQAKKEESDIATVMNLAPSEYIESLRLGVVAAQASYDTAQKDFAAKESLLSEGAISNIELDAARASKENARSNYESNKRRYEESVKQFNALKQSGKSEKEINDTFRKSAKMQLDASIDSINRQMEQVQEQIKHGLVYADADGIITSYPARNTNVLSVGSVIANIKTDENKKQIEVDVLTDVVPYLKLKDTAEVEFNFRGKKNVLTGKISEIYDFATKNVSSLGLSEYRVRAIVDMDAKNEEMNSENDDLIRDGFNANVKFKLFHAQGIAIPIGAVYESEGKSYCFVVNDGKTVKKEIEIEYESSTFAVIGSGLEEGELVVRNADREDLADGIKIKMNVIQ